MKAERGNSSGQLKAGETFGEAALMTGNPLLADFIAESRCEVLLIPVSLFQSIIVAEPGAVQHISRTIAERMKMLVADPAKTSRRICAQGDDPYGLKLKGETTGKDSRHQLRFVIAQILVSTTRQTNRAMPTDRSSALALTSTRLETSRPQRAK